MPEVGFNQGDNVSGEAYQPGCIVVSGTLTVYPKVYIPFGGERLRVNSLMFSYDRQLCAPSIAAAIRLADECVYGTRSKAGTMHPGKLQFYSWTLEGDTMGKVRAPRIAPRARTARFLSIIVSNSFSDFSGCEGRGGLRGKHTTTEASTPSSSPIAWWL